MCNSKAIKICKNQHTDLLRFLFTEDYLKIEKGLELVSRPCFLIEMFGKHFSFVIYINWPNLITKLCLLLKLFSKVYLLFHA